MAACQNPGKYLEKTCPIQVRPEHSRVEADGGLTNTQPKEPAMRHSVQLGFESLESRFAPASLSGHLDFQLMPWQQATPTTPVLGGLASSPPGVAKMNISYGSSEVSGSADPGGDGI